MAQTYFIWKGIDSRTMGLEVSKYPDFYRGKERGQEIDIPGRQGKLFLPQNYDEPVFDPINMTVTCHLRPEADISKICRWLHGKDMVIFGHQPSYAYEAYVNNQISFSALISASQGWRGFSIPFTCQPYKVQYPLTDWQVLFDARNGGEEVYPDVKRDNEAIDIGGSWKIYQINNPGDMSIPCKFRVYGAGVFNVAVIHPDGTTYSMVSSIVQNGLALDWQTLGIYDMESANSDRAYRNLSGVSSIYKSQAGSEANTVTYDPFIIKPGLNKLGVRFARGGFVEQPGIMYGIRAAQFFPGWRWLA